jgi:hypothetical protein
MDLHCKNPGPNGRVLVVLLNRFFAAFVSDL